jgi:hypothetical protein
VFAILYPASLLHRIGFQVSLWYVFVTTYFKAFLFTCLYNIQYSLEDPFNQDGVDCIRLHDFEFPLLSEPVPPLRLAGSQKVEEKISATVIPPDVLNQT